MLFICFTYNTFFYGLNSFIWKAFENHVSLNNIKHRKTGLNNRKVGCYWLQLQSFSTSQVKLTTFALRLGAIVKRHGGISIHHKVISKQKSFVKDYNLITETHSLSNKSNYKHYFAHSNLTAHGLGIGNTEVTEEHCWRMER